MIPPLLDVRGLRLTLFKGQCAWPVLHGLSFAVDSGETVGLVGASGSGKSLTASAILGLLPLVHALEGEIRFEGEEWLAKSSREQAVIRGTRMSLIPQDPSLALNPLLSIGRQLVEGLRYHKGMSKRQAEELGMEWLERVSIDRPRSRMRQYPHEISGGMKQRVLIAMALICKPALLIADEPTTALDLTVQMQILDLLQRLQEEERLSLLLITHDLGVAAHCCQRLMAMHSGRLVEMGSAEQLLSAPCHPHVRALVAARRRLEMGDLGNA